jgi:hypothetical protein
MTSKAEITDMLSERIVTVKFKKADGSERVMKCTLMQSMIPQTTKTVAETNNTVKERRENDSVVAAWDVEAEGWRSFRLDSIIEIQ